jgi:hypothetical protein
MGRAIVVLLAAYDERHEAACRRDMAAVACGSAGIEHARRCASGETRRCFTYAPGIVSDPGAGEGNVRVRTDDGPIEIALRGSPSPIKEGPDALRVRP